MPKEKFKGGVDSIKLVAGHSVILSHLPDKLSLVKVSDKLSTNPSQEVTSFGLFDNSTPNYTTYYPEVTSEDLNPKDSDFIEPVFRMLSNTVVQHRYNPIEFPEDVLKASMPKLVGMTVNVDHETALGNAIGSIKSVEWQDSYKVNGLEVPAGINAVLKIDGKSNPRIARGIMMDPPSIHSNSVTVGFSWKPSHTNLDESEFYSKLGTFDDKGKLVRKVATEIFYYAETSLVGMGADPFAQKVNKNKIVNPGLSKSRNPITKKQLSDNPEDVSSTLVMDWKNLNQETGSFTCTSFEDNEQNNNNEEEMKELLSFLEGLFGFNEGDLTEENYEEKLNAIGVEFTELKGKEDFDPETYELEGVKGVENITNSLKELSTLKGKLPEGKTLDNVLTLSEVSTEVLKDFRAETLRLYKLSIGENKEDENIINLINTSDYSTLKSLKNQYDNISDDELEFTCSDCGSHSVTRAKAKPGDDGDSEHVQKTTGELVSNITSRKRGKYIFDTEK